ncbi:sigma-70 family RNA polymerase sigma factor [Okibacterium fritillariae]|uniref:sigma-70 family RNA polymerase sigma factor n=1 Tax=Okibacterium fritillariae TaxID=123320 RepID=UPI0009A81FAC|nr:sigma-70 family RNA polymerase sigma factor [Okibacterium fritillariae]
MFNYPPKYESASEQELVVYLRTGDTAALAELWKRHAPAGRIAAARFPDHSADDLVSEAFTRILAAVQNGKGPEESFRPYLLTTIKHLGYERTHLPLPIDPANVEQRLDKVFAGPSVETLALRNAAKNVGIKIFQQLPKRWQEVLWLSEIEGLKPREIAPLLNLKPNAVSALHARARKGMRDAWLRDHLSHSQSPFCESVINQIPGYLRGALTPEREAAINEHLGSCDGCSASLEEARTIASGLLWVLLPMLFTVAGIAPSIVGADSSAMAMSSASAMAAADRTRSRSLFTGAACGLVAVSLSAIVTFAIVAEPTAKGPISASESINPHETEPTETPSDTPIYTPTNDPDAESNTAPIPGPPTQSAPTSPPKPETVLENSTPVVSSDETTPAPQEGLEGKSGMKVADMQVLSLVVESDPTGRYLPIISGGKAEVGATIQVLSSEGALLGSVVDTDGGEWQITDLPGMGWGAQTFAVRQINGARMSQLSGSSTVEITEPPTLISPKEGDLVDSSSYVMEIVGEPNATMQRIANGSFRDQIMLLDDDGEFVQSFSAPVGEMALGLRYVDPSFGRFGPTRIQSFTAQ